MNTLKPHLSHASVPDLQIKFDLTENERIHYFSFEISGELDQISVAPKKAITERKDELWKTTCFEVFLKFANSEKYWEFNFSPSGDWNAYSFDEYRKGMRCEEKISKILFSRSESKNGLAIKVGLDLLALTGGVSKLDLSATAVLRAKSGEISYWALAHACDEPDFHDKRSFIHYNLLTLNDN